MKVSTKQRIIKTAIELFNKNGYGASTLFELADKKLGMTRGNLTYHFKNKDQLLLTIVDEMWQKILVERNKSRQLPSFKNLHNEIQLYHRFQQEYAFFFLDTQVLTHPVIKTKVQEMTTQTIKDCEMAIAFAIASGNMHPEPFKGIYHNIAFKTWMLSFFWLSQQTILAKQAPKDGSKMVWTMLLPHFTKKGIAAFEAYFGKEYLENLGKPFDTQIDNFISF